MALKRKRKVQVDDINFKMQEVAVKGLLVTYDLTNAGFVRVPTTLAVTDKVAGVLMIDVVNKDFNAQPVNFQKLETGFSGFVRLAREGELGTDQTAASAVFGAGSGVYVADGGKVSNVPDATLNELVGTALGPIDSNGFVEIYFDIN